MKKRYRVFMRRAVTFVAMICSVGVIAPVYAANPIIGQIGTAFVVGSAAGASQDFRVYLAGNPVICNGQTWAYVNIADPNYNAIVANILAARAMGASITLYWAQQTNGYCEISFFSW
jgi:hypothetical protein